MTTQSGIAHTCLTIATQMGERQLMNTFDPNDGSAGYGGDDNCQLLDDDQFYFVEENKEDDGSTPPVDDQALPGRGIG